VNHLVRGLLLTFSKLPLLGRKLDTLSAAYLHFPRKPIGEQAPADEISPPHLRGRKLSQPGSVR